MKTNKISMFQSCIVAVILFLFLAAPALGEKWSFAVIADNRAVFQSYRNVLEEIRDLTVNPDGAFSPADFILACGDISPVEKNHEIYRDVFRNGGPLFLPVRGNHERSSDVGYILRKMLPSSDRQIRRYDQNSVNYFLDWKNVRVIVLDQYSPLARSFDNPPLIKWLEDTLASATGADHIFIAFHEPYLPVDAEADPFWSLLLRHNHRVKAVFAGHMHMYHRRLVPDRVGGIHLINAGNAGQTSHGDKGQTIVEVLVNGKDLSFRTVQAPDGTDRFRVRDEWRATGPVAARPHQDAIPSRSLESKR